MNKSFIDEIVKRMESLELDNPISAILIFSNGKNLQGFPYRLDKISNIDKVDIICYLLKNLDININDIEECKKLNDKNIYMIKEIRQMELW